ncbi:hypothetical protein MNBD_DELTA01-185 [hydrothermal vent metagenome]|uniref:Uncharacterized protein n=1 Tax=hydrothermal vent metagenome TaxID=652676 RepID=A0A3B0QYZ5_9ZZZZ
MRRLLPLLFIFSSFFFIISLKAHAMRVIPYKAAPDQVLVLYNADWQPKTSGIKAGKGTGQESRELAEYYVRMYTDPVTGKRPYLLGLKCRHKSFDRDLNGWFVKEVSKDNGNGIVYKGKGRAPRGKVLRDMRRVEIKIDEPGADPDSIRLSIRSNLTKEKVAVPKASAGGVKPGGYYIKKGKSAYLLSLDASKFFSGPVTVFFSVRDKDGKVIKKLKLPYYDHLDFEFSETGPDGVADDKILEEDVLNPVRKFLEDPANALPGGVQLKDHILYIVVVRGMPFSASGVFGIERGATSRRGDHGSRGSLEQRLQTLYYDWGGRLRPPVVAMQVAKGPGSENGVASYAITTAMRRPQMGRRWNPYMHKDAYSYIRRGSPKPEFYQIPPLRLQRELVPEGQFAYGVTRIDGVDLSDARRIIDYSLYATKYLRPEMDCRVRAGLAAAGKEKIADLTERMRKAEEEGLWGAGELDELGFITQVDKGNYKDSNGQGLPFLARPVGEEGACAENAEADWRLAGFYPGGMHRHVESSNGLNYSRSTVWQQLRKGVTVTAGGAPAYSGGPHITNATFWDNRILTRYLLRGRDLGDVFLNSTLYVNWSTSLIGDPLMHPDLSKTKMDKAPPELDGELSFEQYAEFRKVYLEVRARLRHSRENPEVALLKATLVLDGGVDKITAISPLYSARPELTVEGLKPGSEYMVRVTLIDPYGNRTELPGRRIKTMAVN